jgi:hypothetical protein
MLFLTARICRILGLGLCCAGAPGCAGGVEPEAPELQGEGPEPEAARPELPAEERLAQIRGGLEAAPGLHRQGQRAQAAALVRAAYTEHFEPLEPALRPLDPDRVLELEYGFGRLAAELERPADPSQLQERVLVLISGTESLVARLPRPAPPELPAELPPASSLTPGRVGPGAMATPAGELAPGAPTEVPTQPAWKKEP